MKNKAYVLELEFDIGQVTTALQSRFITPDKKTHNVNKKGSLAGTFEFRAGEKLRLRVIANAKAFNHEGKREDLNLKINDCTLTSLARYQPAIGRDFDMNLSPFNRLKACVNIGKWGRSKPAHDKQFKSETIESNDVLDIIKGDGQWEISGYLSVSYNANGKTLWRSYYFDPEGSVSSGIGLDPP
ncbi:MAG: hypothetical protein ABJN69_07710 [Hellea sp.]